MTNAQLFLNNSWADKSETMSGSGSTLANTKAVREHLPLLLEKYNIESMFDAPCGDGNWIQHVDLTCAYTGGDLVQKFVDANPLQSVVFDITLDTFPAVDLWMCRACLYHLSNAEIQLAIDNFKQSNIKYALITSHTGNSGGDIRTGSFRVLNLEEHNYFGLDAPIDQIPDVLFNNMQENLLLFVNPRITK